MTDTALLQSAIDAAGLSARRFAVEILDVDERTVRRWLAGDRELAAPVRVVCRAIATRPRLAAELARALGSLRGSLISA